MTELQRIKKDLKEQGLEVIDTISDASSSVVKRTNRPSFDVKRNGMYLMSFIFDKKGKLEILTIPGIKEHMTSWLHIQSNPNYLIDSELEDYEDADQ